MTVRIEMEDEVARGLTAQAAAHGLSLEAFLLELAKGVSTPPANGNGHGAEAVRIFDAALDELFAADLRRLSASSETYSRGDIYVDHD